MISRLSFWLILLPLFLLSACKQVQPVFNVSVDTQGGQVDVSIVGIDLDTGQRSTLAIEADFAYLDHNWRINGNGELARVNQLLPTGQPFVLPPSLLPLIKLAKQFAARSEGLFDPAIGKLVDLWGFHAPPVECRPIPQTSSIADLVQARPRMRDVELDGMMLHSNNTYVQLDFSAFLPGYGVDLAIARLRELGIRNASVSFGGRVRAIGDRDGQPWSVPIHRPTGGGILALVEIFGDESLVSIGNHERSFLYNGQRYHDLLDPRNGYPVSDTLAVTVLHDNAVTADAAAHALFIAGPREWERIASEMGIENVLLVDKDGVLHMTATMEKRLKILDKSPDIQLSAPLESVFK